jgi:hypothetical protein
MIEFIVLLALIVLVLYLGTNGMGKEKGEGFQNANAAIPYLSACPQRMTTFYLPDGRPACCDGSLTDGRCRLHDQCVMTGTGTPDMPNCLDILNREYKQKSNSHCPSSMTTYFEDPSTKKKGCTSGGLDADHFRPALPTQPTCYIYPTLEENLDQSDSCAVQKALEETPCFGANCKKLLSPTVPPLITIQFQDDTGMVRTSYTRTSVLYYLDKTRPGWREKGVIDVDKNIQTAEVAKAYFVDKTFQAKDLQL